VAYILSIVEEFTHNAAVVSLAAPFRCPDAIVVTFASYYY
jgi:hypothetical protein